ncbi:Na+/H+ antiporter subunit D, partial [Chloroflexota bacterium]
AMPLVLGLYMVGAFSISGFPLFSGFVSKSMVIYAAELSHLEVAALLLSVASVGTFLHTGLKLPYFTWFGPDRKLKPHPIPTGMYLGMALTASLCFAIGVYPALLYNLLPFPVDYAPYTTTHLLETIPLLIFTGLGFWILIGKLGGEATITMDTDWVYRRPSGLAYRLFVLLPSRIFNTTERITMTLAYSVAGLSVNPAGSLLRAINIAGYYFFGSRHPTPEPRVFDPHRYRFRLGTMTLIVLLSFVVLMLLLIWEVFSKQP